MIVGDLFGGDLADNHYMIMPKLLHGFARAGCAVHAFNDREVARTSTPFRSSAFGRPAANRKLIAVCRRFQPDLLLLGHCELISNETIQSIRGEMENVRVAYRNVDSLDDQPNLDRIRRRAKVVDAIFVTTALPLPTFGSDNTAPSYFIPNPVDQALDGGRCFAHSNQENDLFFALDEGHANTERANLARSIARRQPSLRFDIRGIDGRPSLRGAAYLQALTNARMGLSVSRQNKHYLYASDRMSQYIGNGLLTFVPRSTGFNDLFSEDEVAFFGEREELLDKLTHFEEHDGERRRVAEAGWRAAHAMFASERIAKYIIERSFDQPLSESYPWPTEISNQTAVRPISRSSGDF
ncbi:glycosyltransferase family 1 protein [Pelagibius litoralis]|uniref:Glycosyltransferase family 1 protein n=1 Tax=Pelagibius litoralis TaxID=374515 RepID=A0A967C1I0_9PROT|nr:glycosyltransferase [Pelagibius litoralis]NIA67171.1 glycosyltransferase family 1 protein [Pelagibius litoralis]